jgi:hypothetical protein
MLFLGVQVASGVSAIVSAWFWLSSARVDIPHPVNDSYAGNGPFATAMTRQTKLNARAAGCAALAALLQAGGILLK